MIFPVCLYYHDWPNTSGNHAGMEHLMRSLAENSSLDIKLISDREPWSVPPRNALLFYTEYLSDRKQLEFALAVRRYGMTNPIAALLHVPIFNLVQAQEPLSAARIVEGLSAANSVVTFGKRLTDEYKELAQFRSNEKNISFENTFHYVDTGYYFPVPQNDLHRLRVISTGIYNRDYELLDAVMSDCPFADFVVYLNEDPLMAGRLSGNENCFLRPYVPEPFLRNDLQNSDIHISTSRSTHGSNAILTSMATGCAQVTSDNGSIRDYVTEKNACLCTSKDDFVKALSYLDKNRDYLKSMRNEAVKAAGQFTLEKSVEWFDYFLKRTWLSVVVSDTVIT